MVKPLANRSWSTYVEAMRVARLTVGSRVFYLPPDSADELMAAAAIARERGQWWRFQDSGGLTFRVLIPSQALLVFEEYEVDDRDLEPEGNDWSTFDYDEWG